MDLKKFAKDESLSEEYRQSVFNIPEGKWGEFPTSFIEGIDRPEVMALSELRTEDGRSAGFQFVETNLGGNSIKAISQMQGLHWLRTDISNNDRKHDPIQENREVVKELIEAKSSTYVAAEEEGSLIGQENEILRIMYGLNYEEEQINLVRRAFKTKDVFLKRDVTQLKTRIIRLRNKNEVFQKELTELLDKAKVASSKKQPNKDSNLTGHLSLVYFNRGKSE
jgi:hypothetical protein